MQRKFNAIADTMEWQDADFFGKVKIAWDEFIADPFSEWWNSIGKAKFADFAQDIGAGIGTGLKIGVMTLLGIDIGETLDEGVSIGASFAKGFSDGFDFEAVSENLWQGFRGMLSNVGKLFNGEADLSSVLSAVMLGKIASPFISMGRGAASLGKGLFGANPATGTSLMGSFLGSAASGTGLLGKSGLLAIKLGAGNLAGGASMSAAALSATGMAAGGGAIAAGATLISGALDAYKAIKSEDKRKSEAYGESAAWKFGGVTAGAAAGAAIGSFIPGIGTVAGGLIGAGVGGIAGWIRGNKEKERYEEEVRKNLEEAKKEAERAQKVFEATGMSIEDVTFKNEALTQAMNDSEVSVAQFALMFREECAEVAKKAFGDITLSLAEVKKIAGEITFADMAEELSEFADATADAEAALNRLESSVSSLRRENWKVGLGMELSETDKDSYKSAIEKFLDESQTYIDDNHYEATVALKLLAGGESDTSGLDSYYESLKSQIEALGAQLTDNVDIALEDGVITLDEAAELENLQEQISDITNKLAEAKTEAEMQALKIRHNGAALDIDSFNAMQEELQANVASASEQYESALTLTLTNLNLQLADGAITQTEYDEAVAEATEGYYAQINELNARVSTFNLESIAAAWGSRLSDIMPDIEGTTAEKLSTALNNAMLVRPDIGTWTTADVISWMGLDKLDLDTAEQNTIASELIQTAFAVPEGTKQQIIQNFKDKLPTKDEIMEGVIWESLTEREMGAMMNALIPGTYSDLSDMDATKMFSDWGNYEIVKEFFADKIVEAFEESTDMGKVKAWLDKYYIGFDTAMEQYGPISDEYYEQLVSEWQEAGTAYGDALNSGVSESLLSGSSQLRTDLQTALETAADDPFTVSPTVNVLPNYDIDHRYHRYFMLAGQGVSRYAADGHAAGGYVSGGPQLSWLAEEGYGEFVIPTNPSRRARALDLYEQAGTALGVSAYADGGYVGGPIGYNGTTEGDHSSAEGAKVQVSVSMPTEFVIHGGDGQSEENIVRVIKKHMKEMADELGGEIAEKLEKVFSNMPLKEA